MPSDKKREQVRMNIRMKMYLASGIKFPSTLDAQAQKKRRSESTKVAEKVTETSTVELLKAIKLKNEDIWSF